MLSPYYTPTPRQIPTYPPWKRVLNPLALAVIAIVGSASYLFGVWEHGDAGCSHGATVTSSLPSRLTTTINPHTPSSSSSSNSTSLDFSTRHSFEDNAAAAAVSTNTSSSLQKYPLCDAKYSEYTPCEDVERSMKYKREKMIFRERHCPTKNELLKCRVPAPYGYRYPFKWPLSRDFAWYNNVPHKELTVEKAIQNWIRFEGDKFRFPGGGTMFTHGADAYIEDLGKLINLKDGSIRTALDTGCGVASWGAYLLSRNIITMSIAPRDSHEAQVQFALERGVAALIGVLGSKRLPYPSRSFDMAHCSRCLIPWNQYDGQYLIELDRVLRPGGYWIISGPPINWRAKWKGWQRTEEDLSNEQTQIENIAKSLCWKKLVEKKDFAVWQKPFNHLNCKKYRRIKKLNPPVCPAQDPDKAWYTNLETCLTPLPDVSNDKEVSGGKLENWPNRLSAIPPRISNGTVNGVTADDFVKDSELWKKRVTHYKKINNQLSEGRRYRNILDMNASFGGFAAALINDPVWVMNIVPVEATVNTLGVIYERGLIGTYQSWCEAMSTYPRTYDLIHADSIFTLYKGRCEMEDILLEMDRILRPEGSLIIRDDVDMLFQVKQIADALNWESQLMDHEDGPLVREKILFAVKSYSTSPATGSR